MSDPSTFRDSTQIVMPSDALEGFREELTEKFTLTLFEVDGTTRAGNERPEAGNETPKGKNETPKGKNETPKGKNETPEADGDEGETQRANGDEGETSDDSYVRIIGSPVEIKAATDFLSRRGVSLR